MDSICNSPLQPPVGTSEQSFDPCPICYTDFGTLPLPVVTTKCGHRFHLKCITDWFEKLPQSLKNRKCCFCQEQAVPMVRKDGGKRYEDSEFCESTPLQACRAGDLATLQQLLETESGIARELFRSAVFMADITLLHVVAQNGHLGCLKALIAAGADVDAAVEGPGDTPLYLTAAKGHLDCSIALIGAGANVNAKRNSGDAALYIAAQKGHLQCMKLLIDKGAAVDARANNGATPLCAAASEGHPECLKALIKAGADVNAGLHNGETPLHMATRKGHTECVELLIDNGAAVDARRVNNGATPLCVAASEGHPECLKALIKAGADVNAGLHNGETPLHMATRKGHTECVELLTAAGAIDQAPEQQNTFCSVM